MKNIFTSILLLFTGFSLQAQSISWSAPVEVANNSYDNLRPRIVLDRSGDPMIVWGSGTSKAYFSRWTGSAFSTPMDLNPVSIPIFAASWAGPEIGSHGDTVYVVFKQTPETDTNSHIYIVRSFDGGQTFGSPVRVDHIGDGLSRFGYVATNASGHPLVAYMRFDPGFGDPRYVVTRSNDFGGSFLPDVKASNTTGGEACDCCPATLLSAGNRAIMLYRNNLSNTRTIWAGISTDNGASFTGDVEIDNTNWTVMVCPASGPDGVVVGDSLYTVFRSSISGSRIYLSKTALSTQQLGSSAQFTPNFTGLISQDYPRIANTGNAAAIVWKQAHGASKACISVTNNITNGFPASYDTVAMSGVQTVDVAMEPGIVHVVWENTITGTVMYRKGVINASVMQFPDKINTLELYPNPASGYIVIPIKDVSDVSMADMNGKRFNITPVQVNGKTCIPVSALTPGLYFVELITNDGKAFRSKITIQ